MFTCLKEGSILGTPLSSKTLLKTLLTHPGTQYAPMLAAELHRQGLLFKYVSGLNFTPGNKLKWGLLRLLRAEQLAKRRLVNIPAEKLYQIPWPDLRSLYRMRAGHDQDRVFFEGNNWFQRIIPERLISEADLVIGFDTSSEILANRCKMHGKPYIMDISIGHPLYKEQVFSQIRHRFPGWQQELKPKSKQNLASELREMELATHLVGATVFTQQTYAAQGIALEKISVNPYGTDLSFFRLKSFLSTRRLFTFLYFSKLSARKGFPWLCEIWQQFYTKNPQCRLIAAGYGELPAGFTLPAGIDMRGFIHPSDRARLFDEADVFVFPSFFEGFGQVIIETMACGLPVITTTNTVGPELIDNGKNGMVIEPGNDQQLLEAMQFFADNQQHIEVFGNAARERVLPLTWQSYGERWSTIIKAVVAGINA